MIEVSRATDGLAVTLSGSVRSADAATLHKVTSLTVKGSNEAVRVESPLHLPYLERIGITDCDQPLDEILSKETLNSLKTLGFLRSPECISRSGYLGELKSIEKLYVRHQPICDDDWMWITAQPRIKSLGLTATNTTDLNLVQLSCKESLLKLDVYKTQVELRSENVRGATFPSLICLEVSGNPLSEKIRDKIHSLFPCLQRLHMTDTRVTFEELRSLKCLPGLRLLETGNPDIDFDLTDSEFWDL